MDSNQITYSTEADWPWIIEQHATTAWASLTPELQSVVNIQTVRESLVEQVQKFRTEHGVTNQVFIAYKDDQNVGYVWVGQVRRAFTGVMQAHIINLFVKDDCRGQGVGARLMERAEIWAREHHLKRISLSVAAHNSTAINLYKKFDYRIETLRMQKTLGDGNE